MSDEVLNPFEGGVGGPPAVQFNEQGDAAEGTIVDIDYQQETDPVTGEVKTFPNGKPRPCVVVHLEQSNGELVRDFVKGRSVSQFRDKVWAVHGLKSSPRKGAYYKRVFTDIAEPARKGLNGEKLFEITYRAPEEKQEERELI